VFQLDPDFQERMFSRQMAVMKGQAWNVVETLKTPDHGPLELTRRAKVCVWDDLVDVPIAVPMRVTSAEQRRKAEPELHQAIEEEIDIGAAKSSASANKNQQVEDLLGFSSPLPNPGRFDLSSPRAQSPDGIENQSRSVPNGDILDNPFEAATSRPQPPPRASYQGPSRPRLNMYAPQREQRFSFTARRNSVSLAQHLFGDDRGYDDDDDDMEGDLGYAAAEGMEGNRRKVIVERLETVKARNPVFTWC
jgi:phosphatidylinositol 4-kinase type 2